MVQENDQDELINQVLSSLLLFLVWHVHHYCVQDQVYILDKDHSLNLYSWVLNEYKRQTYQNVPPYNEHREEVTDQTRPIFPNISN